jgi:hypothetical protein
MTPMFRALLALLVCAGCQFDASGQTGDDGQGGFGLDGAAPGPGPDAAAPDAGAPDAVVPCADDDGDGFAVARSEGAECGDADCDDSDADVYPGQPGAFTLPSNSGSFDFNCDGVEEKLSDPTAGGECHLDWFTCVGTGWVGGVPACGEAGVWHRCEGGFLSCTEAEAIAAAMPCR